VNCAKWIAAAVFAALAAVPTDAKADEVGVVAHASEPSWVPAVTLGLGTAASEVRFESPGSTDVAADSQLVSDLGVALRYHLRDLSAGWTLRGDSELAVGALLTRGEFPVRVRQAALFERRLGAGFTAVLGPRATLSLDTATASRSAAALGVYLGARWRGVELAYSPAVAFALGRERTDVFDGVRARGADTGALEHSLVLRVRFASLSW